jgi:hypothetical protein
LKFSDVIIVVAALFVVFTLLEGVFGIALIPMNITWGLEVSEIVSLLVAALIVGYVFASKIQEDSKMMSIGKIVVLAGAATMFVNMIWSGALGHYALMVDETLRNMYSTGSWTNTDWASYEAMALFLENAVSVGITIVFSFIGLYLGSMLKPKKS